MWTEEMHLECLTHFRNLATTDPIAKSFVWLLEHVGHVGMYESVPVYNRVIEVILTQ